MPFLTGPIFDTGDPGLVAVPQPATPPPPPIPPDDLLSAATAAAREHPVQPRGAAPPAAAGALVMPWRERVLDLGRAVPDEAPTYLPSSLVNAELADVDGPTRPLPPHTLIDLSRSQSNVVAEPGYAAALANLSGWAGVPDHEPSEAHPTVQVPPRPLSFAQAVIRAAQAQAQAQNRIHAIQPLPANEPQPISTSVQMIGPDGPGPISPGEAAPYPATSYLDFVRAALHDEAPTYLPGSLVNAELADLPAPIRPVSPGTLIDINRLQSNVVAQPGYANARKNLSGWAGVQIEWLFDASKKPETDSTLKPALHGPGESPGYSPTEPSSRPKQPTLTPKQLAEARKLERIRVGGAQIANPHLTVAAAAKTKLPLAVACALLSLESFGGRNVWGTDTGRYAIFTGGYDAASGKQWGRKYAYTHTVTEAGYRAFHDEQKRTGKSQGVGPTMLTDPGLQRQADQLGGAWKPYPNMQVGFRTFEKLITQYRNVHDAAFAYNAGSLHPPSEKARQQAERYAENFVASARAWAAKLSAR